MQDIYREIGGKIAHEIDLERIRDPDVSSGVLAHIALKEMIAYLEAKGIVAPSP